MWPVDLLLMGAGPIESLSFDGGVEAYRSLEPLVRVSGQFVLTLVATMVVLGLFQERGPRTVRKARASPVISCCIGLPAALVIGLLAGTGYLIVGTSLGTFFGIPLVVVGLTVLPILTALGIVAVGRSIAARLGRDQFGAGILAGSLLVGLAGLSVALTLAVVGLAAALGIGAGCRVLFAVNGTTRPDERTVPPANKI